MPMAAARFRATTGEESTRRSTLRAYARSSTRCGGQGLMVFYGMAKPVRAPKIGPAHGFWKGCSGVAVGDGLFEQR